MKSSFTFKLVGIHFLFLGLPLILNSFFFFQRSYETQLKVAHSELKELSMLHSFALREIEEEDHAIIEMLRVFLSEKASFADIKEKFWELKRIQQSTDYEILKNENSQWSVVFSTFPETQKSIWDLFSEIPDLKEGEIIKFLQYESLSPQKRVPYLISVINLGEDTFLVMKTNLTGDLKRVVAPQYLFGVKFAVLTADGIVFAASDPSLIGSFLFSIDENKKQALKKRDLLSGVSLQENKLFSEEFDLSKPFTFSLNNQDMIGYFSEIPNYGFSLLAYSPKEIFFKKALGYFFWIISLFMLVIVLAFLASAWLSYVVTRPLKQLSFLMGKVGEGDYDVRFHPQPFGYEINILGEAFNKALHALKETVEEQQQEAVRSEVIRREVAIAKEVQESLIAPSNSQINSLSVTDCFLPAEKAGGIFSITENKYFKDGTQCLFIMIGNVHSQGVSSALIALTLRSLFRAHASTNDSITQIVEAVRKDFMHREEAQEIEMSGILGIFNPNRHTLEYLCLGEGAIFWSKTNEGLKPVSMPKNYPLSFSQESVLQENLFNLNERGMCVWALGEAFHRKKNAEIISFEKLLKQESRSEICESMKKNYESQEEEGLIIFMERES